jgi:hypothetical protein
LPLFRNIHYIDYEGGEHYYTVHEVPSYLEKKVKLLTYFMNYMKEHLLKAGANIQVLFFGGFFWGGGNASISTHKHCILSRYILQVLVLK